METTKKVMRQTFKNKPEDLRNKDDDSSIDSDEHPILRKTVSVGRFERLKILNKAERKLNKK